MKKTLGLASMTALALINTSYAGRIQYSMDDAVKASKDEGNNFVWTFSDKVQRMKNVKDETMPLVESDSEKPGKPEPEPEPEPSVYDENGYDQYGNWACKPSTAEATNALKNEALGQLIGANGMANESGLGDIFTADQIAALMDSDNFAGDYLDAVMGAMVGIMGGYGVDPLEQATNGNVSSSAVLGNVVGLDNTELLYAAVYPRDAAGYAKYMDDDEKQELAALEAAHNSGEVSDAEYQEYMSKIESNIEPRVWMSYLDDDELEDLADMENAYNSGDISYDEYNTYRSELENTIQSRMKMSYLSTDEQDKLAQLEYAHDSGYVSDEEYNQYKGAADNMLRGRIVDAAYNNYHNEMQGLFQKQFDNYTDLMRYVGGKDHIEQFSSDKGVLTYGGGGKGDCDYVVPEGTEQSECYTADTLISLADGSCKKAEEITYNDELLVWNFDEGKFDKAKPIWLQIPKTTEEYNYIRFSDGSVLKTINQHRILNIESGKFTYPMTDDTPIGTHTLNSKGEIVTVVEKKVIKEKVTYYNLITERHINCFASNICTSCRLNNIYPIKDLKFVKDNRELTPYSQFSRIDRRWYNGLRLSEQPAEINRDHSDNHGDKTVEDYVLRLIKMMQPDESLSFKAC